MKKAIALLILAASLAVAQTGKDVTVCWQSNVGQADQGPQTCKTLPTGSVTIVTLDLRPQPLQYVVVQPIPDYQISAMQSHVTNQTYNLQQADGSLKTTQRYSSVQSLLMQYLIRAIILPSLQLYPPTGADAGKNTIQAVMTDVMTGTQVSLVQ